MSREAAVPDVDVLLAAQHSAWQPPSRWQPVAELAFDWRPSVLVIGRPLGSEDRRRIQRCGLVEHVETLTEGLIRLGEARWDAVVVSPSIKDETDGLRFVRAFKAAELVGASARLKVLRLQYAKTPFVVQPIEGDRQFAVFATASRWFLGDTAAVSLGEAVLTVIQKPDPGC